jgi:hypothetical protein
MRLKILYINLIFLPLLTCGQEGFWDENEILQYGFPYPLDQSFGLDNKEIINIEDLNKQIEEFFIPAQLYFNAYNDLKIDSSFFRSDSIFYVEYNLGGKQLKSYSSFKPGFNQVEKFKTAIVIIPGSGENQSIEIFNGVGYHLDIANNMANLGDVFIATKPNQDYLAIHRGGGKLDYSFLVNYMLNKGGSYSVSYLVNTLATVKYLKTVYDRVFVVGLSQGGLATLLNSLQSSPDAAVIASGFTITRDLFEWSGVDQIIIPNSSNIYSKEKIREIISRQSTNYFFTWGASDIGIYKLEAENNYTCNYFSDLKNVKCQSYDQGHHFPRPHTANFLYKIPFASIDIEITELACSQNIYLKPVTLSSHTITDYKWYRNDTLYSMSGNTLYVASNDTLYFLDNNMLMVDMGGKYKLVVETDEAKIYASKEIDIDQIHFEKKLNLNQTLLEAPKGFTSYKWYLDDKPLEDENENFIVIQKEGKYTCCLTSDLRSHTSDEIIIKEGYPYIVNNFEALFTYPNPNDGVFKIVLTSSHVTSQATHIIIYNEVGQKVYENVVLPYSKISEFEINVSDLKKGKYIIHAVTSDKSFTKLIILQ